MLNQYYNFLANNLFDWLESQSNMKPGDKYFVLLDSSSDVENFMDSLKEISFKNKFFFKSKEFSYSTIGLLKDNLKILFIAPVSRITQDFLVTVRNRVNTNSGEWANTVVFFIVHEALDSIIGGAYDASQKDSPFNTESIQKKIDNEIESKKGLTDGKKKIIKNYLNDLKETNNKVLKDFETIFSILEKGDIDEQDFNSMGYFPDSTLDSLPLNVIENRLKENRRLFDKIESYHELVDVSSYLSSELSGEVLIKKLSNPLEWKQVEYREIDKGINELNKDKNTRLNFEIDSFLDDEETNWFRVEGQSAAKKKKAHLLMSSAGNKENEFSFEIYFDSTIYKKDIIEPNTFLFQENRTKIEDFEVTIKGNKIIIKLNNFDNNVTYGGLLKLRHRNINNLTFDVRYMIVPFSLKKIKNIRPNFKIEVIKTKKEFYFSLSPDIGDFEIGEEIEEELDINFIEDLSNCNLNNKKVHFKETTFSTGDNDSFRVNTYIGNSFFPISFFDLAEKPVPINPLSIERKRMESKITQLKFIDNKIIVGSNTIFIEKNYKDRLNIEKQMMEENSLYGEIIEDKYYSHDLELPYEIKKAYTKLFEYYIKEETVPSLAIWNKEHLELLSNIIDIIYNKFLLDLSEAEKLHLEISNISKIGVVKEIDRLSVSPINPLMIAYQLELANQLFNSKKIPKENVLSKINPKYLLPYLKFNDVEYQSSYTRNFPRWLLYNRIGQKELSEISSNVIVQRLNDYLSQYKFLFETNKEISLNIASIQITDERSFFNAVILFMLQRIKNVKSLNEINPINIYFDRIGFQSEQLFRNLYSINSMDKLEELLGIKYKKENYEDYEVLDLLKERINIHKIPEINTTSDLEVFFHLTFYQFSHLKELSVAKMEKLGKNYAMKGLLNNSQYHKELNGYVNGFGIGEIKDRTLSNLVTFSSYWNSLVVASNKRTDIYRKGDTLVNNIPYLNQDAISSILLKSSWVTLLNLDVDLSYFFDDTREEILVIHYTDQSSTNQYESVTITSDIKQYSRLLNEFLLEELSDRKNIEIKEIIKNFNVINGQWLLKLISDKSEKRGNKQLLREKLSVISAYKELLGILDHSSFLWVPISLEEILRVSGMIGMSKKEGLFSSKNLGLSGEISDDLLFAGIDLRSDIIKIHLLPIEVKVGVNGTNVIQKAVRQVDHTSNVLKRFLGDSNEDYFMKEFYRNFFLSLILGNLNKMISSGLYYGDKFSEYQEIKDQLMSGAYEISYDIEELYGKGIIFEFTGNETMRKTELISSKNILLVRVPEKDAYNIVADKTATIINKIRSGKFDFSEEILLKNKIKELKLSSCTITGISDSEVEESIVSKEFFDIIEEGTPTLTISSKENDISKKNQIVMSDDKKVDFLDRRILLGKNLDNGKNVFWEYGNKKLANRHLLITGKSGQGKTYFIQTLLSELIKLNVGSLVVDYTDGFLENQLDEYFVKDFGNSIKHRYILREKLPINPFKLQTIDLGGIYMLEGIQDMVDRVVQVIDFVFDLGIQQRSLLSEEIFNGYQIIGDGYTFSHLSNDLKYSDDKSKQNLYGRINTLLSRDPFSYENDFDWNTIFRDSNKVNIFQLKGYQINIQKVLIEFLLWDLYQYATREGRESTPIPIILDEVQNIDFGMDSPAVKILREGRKFGISGIFSTQSLDSIRGNSADAIYNAAEQIHFLPPESQVPSIARSVGSNLNERKDIEMDLKKLRKGEAIVYGADLLADGTLSELRAVTVKITAFSDRLKPSSYID